MKKAALISSCQSYRYSLMRDWSEGSSRIIYTLIGLNPSTADAEVDDNTIRREIDFVKIHGGNCLLKVNLYALRSTDPDALKDKNLSGYQLIGADNWTHVEQALKAAEKVILCWGSHDAALDVAQHLLEEYFDEYGHKFYHLGDLTKIGAPRHPLYLSKTAQLNKVTTLYGMTLTQQGGCK